MQQTKCNRCGHSEVDLHHLNHDIVDGEPQIVFERQPDIKLSNAPKIVFAIPVGSKRLNSHFMCDKATGGCGAEWMDVPAWTTPHMIPVQFMLSYHNLQMPLNVTTALLVESGRLSSEARQIMTKRAIRMGAKYIIYWDDDILPPSDGVYRLYNFMEKNQQVGIAASVCTTRFDPVEPVVYAAHGDGATWDFECGSGARPEPMFACGAGFIIARVSAIIDIIEKLKVENGGIEIPIWADERAFMNHDDPSCGISKRNIFWGHDVRFYRLMQETGYHTVVHGGVICGHLDSQTGKIYTMPDDAPGFKKTQERVNAEKQTRKENQGETQSGESNEGIQAGDAAIEQRAASH